VLALRIITRFQFVPYLKILRPRKLVSLPILSALCPSYVMLKLATGAANRGPARPAPSFRR
jgi:hypothetical protein